MAYRQRKYTRNSSRNRSSYNRGRRKRVFNRNSKRRNMRPRTQTVRIVVEQAAPTGVQRPEFGEIQKAPSTRARF